MLLGINGRWNILGGRQCTDDASKDTMMITLCLWLSPLSRWARRLSITSAQPFEPLWWILSSYNYHHHLHHLRCIHPQQEQSSKQQGGTKRLFQIITLSPMLLYSAISIEILVPRGQFRVMNALSQPVRWNWRSVPDRSAVTRQKNTRMRLVEKAGTQAGWTKNEKIYLG